MGSFLTNVQVLAGRDRDLSPLLAALRADAASASLDEVDEASATDRTVCIAPPDAGGWVAVYDEATESQDGSRLQALAALASSALHAPAFSALVHDSDVLELALFEEGRERDRFHSCPAYFGNRPSKQELERLAGHPERWASVLAPGHTVDDLRRAWRAEDLFAERTLARTCEVLGCDRARAGIGYRYLQQQAVPPGLLTLHFRARTRPAWQQPAGGPPCFAAYSPPGEADAAFGVGDPLRVGCTVHNTGGAARGLTVVVWGPALEQGLITVESLELILGDPRQGRGFTRHSFEPRRDASGRALLVADLEDVALPVGIARDDSRPPPLADLMKMMETRFATQVHVNVVGQVVGAGRADLSIGLVPQANRDQGAIGAHYHLAIDPPLPRPLRALPGDGTSPMSHLFRPLVGTRYLVALVAIAAPRAEAVAWARRGLECALSVLGTSGQVQTSVFRKAGRKPGTGAGKLATIARGKRFENLVASMRDEQVVELVVRAGPAFDPETGPVPGRWGASFGTSILEDREDERVPTLALWADARTLGEETAAALEARWTEVVEGAMAHGGRQGVMWRGGWPATGPLDYTAYETACGVSGAQTTTRTWVDRWLRVPGNHRLWLGPTLAARLDGTARERLATIADLIPQGASLAIRLRDLDQAAAFEAALADLLPAQADAHAAVRAWYDARARQD